MPLSILLIQGDASDARAIKKALFESSGGYFDVEWVSACAASLERLDALGKQRHQGTSGISHRCRGPTALRGAILLSSVFS